MTGPVVAVEAAQDESLLGDSGLRSVVVGVDGSAEGRAALHFAAKVAEGAGATLIAVTAVDPPAGELSPDLHDRIEAEQRASLPDIGIPLAVCSVSPSRHVMRQGRAQDVLVDVATEVDADLIVVGRTGLHSSPGFLHIASVPEQLAHHTSRPLAVIPATAMDFEQVVLCDTPSAATRKARTWSAILAAALGLPLRSNDSRERSELLRSISSGGDIGVCALEQTGALTEFRAGGTGFYLLHRATRPLVLLPPSSDRN